MHYASFMTGKPLPTLRRDVVWLNPDQSAPPPVPAGFTPVMTVVTHDLNYLYNMDQEVIQSAIDFGHLPFVGDPRDPLRCLLDLETTLTVYGLVKRRNCPPYNAEDFVESLSDPTFVTPRLSYLVGRFLHAHVVCYGHQGSVVGIRTATPGIALGADYDVVQDWPAYLRYCDGDGDD